MITKELTVTNPTGLHVRPAGLLCAEAMNHKCKVTFAYKEGTATANAKSVLSILAACIRSGDSIELCCDGEDEEEAMAAISKLIEDGFGESDAML